MRIECPSFVLNLLIIRIGQLWLLRATREGLLFYGKNGSVLSLPYVDPTELFT